MLIAIFFHFWMVLATTRGGIMVDKILLYAHEDLQNIYKRVIVLIEDDSERNIIHCLFQDLSDKLIDNVKSSDKKLSS